MDVEEQNSCFDNQELSANEHNIQIWNFAPFAKSDVKNYVYMLNPKP
jgi:hypothetical protein